MGKRKAHREPEIEIAHEEASSPETGLESILLSGEETDKDDELSPSATLHPRGLHTTSSVVTSVKEMLLTEEDAGEVAVEFAVALEHEVVHERETVPGSEVVPEHGTTPQHETDLPQHEADPLITSVNQEEGVYPMDMSSSSPIIMMPSIGVPEQSPTIGFVLNKPMAIEIPPSLVLSPQS